MGCKVGLARSVSEFASYSVLPSRGEKCRQPIHPRDQEATFFLNVRKKDLLDGVGDLMERDAKVITTLYGFAFENMDRLEDELEKMKSLRISMKFATLASKMNYPSLAGSLWNQQ